MVISILYITCDNICVGHSCQVQLPLLFRKMNQQRLRAHHLLRNWTSNPRRTSLEIRQVSLNRKTITIYHTRGTVPQSRYRQMMTTLSQNLKEVKTTGMPTAFIFVCPIRNDLRGISLTTLSNIIIITYWLLGDKFKNY